MKLVNLLNTGAAGVMALSTIIAPVSTMAATYSDEWVVAYNWAKQETVGLTNKPTIETAGMEDKLTRVVLAKMMAKFAINVLHREPDTSKTCKFKDVSEKLDADYGYGVTEACQLGLMGQDGKWGTNENFEPYKVVTRDIFGTTLSRALWGDTNNTTDADWSRPHLNALNKVGIMKNTTASMIESKGNAILMMQRSAGYINEDPTVTDKCDGLTQLSCLLGGDCPSECGDIQGQSQQQQQTQPGKQTSGKLVVSNSENDSVVITDGYDSILDTITFKTDEEVTIDSITLERIGLSTYKSIEKVWLESEDGVKVTSEKNISSKDEVSFTLDKDYRTIDGTQSFVIVVRSKAASENVGTSIGFNVKEVASSAKDYNNKATKGNTYDFKNYSAEGVRIENTLTTVKNYNFAEGEKYDVAKIRVNAKDVAIKVAGFTLKNNPDAGLSAIDLADIDEVSVAINGTTIKNVKTTQTKKELTVSFPEQEIAIKGKAVFTLSVSLKSNFEDFGKVFQFEPTDASSFVITESSNNVRVKISTDTDGTFNDTTKFKAQPCYINGSKVEFETEKLASTVDIAQGGEGTIAAGTIKVSGQELETSNMYVVVTPDTSVDMNTFKTAIESIELYVGNSPETDVTSFTVSADKKYIYGKMDSINIDEDSKISLVVKIDSDADEALKGKTFTVKVGTTEEDAKNSLSAETMGLKYETTWNPIKTEGKTIGSISISQVKIQAGKATLSNDMTTTKVQFKEKDPMEPKTIFEGTYTAKKQDLNLMNVTIVAGDDYSEGYETSDIEFTVYVKGESVATLTDDDFDFDDDGNWTATTDLGQILVKVDDEPTPIRITASAYAAEGSAATNLSKQAYKVYFDGEDLNNSPAGNANDDCIDIEFVEASDVNLVSNAATKQKDVILAKKNQEVAHFIAKPANKADSATIDSIEITFEWVEVANENDFTIKIDKDDTYTSDFVCDSNVCNNDDINLTIKGETEIKVISKNIPDSDTTVIVRVNGKPYTSTRAVKPAIVRIVSQSTDNTETAFKFDVTFWSEVESETISNVKLFSEAVTVEQAEAATANTENYIYGRDSISDGDVKKVANSKDKAYVKSISYVVDDETIVITKDEASDFFEINGSAITVFGDK